MLKNCIAEKLVIISYQYIMWNIVYTESLTKLFAKCNILMNNFLHIISIIFSYIFIYDMFNTFVTKWL